MSQRGYYMQSSNVVLMTSDANSNTIGKYYTNPILNTCGYNVIFSGGSIDQQHHIKN